MNEEPVVEIDEPGMIRYRDSIAGQITTRSLLMAVVPVLVVGLVTVVSLLVLASRADQARTDLIGNTIGPSRADEARLILVRLDDYVEERIDDVIDWSRSPAITQAAGAPRPEFDRFVNMPIDNVERELDGTTQLDTSGNSSAFLATSIADQSAFAEVFFTDKNGFNVGATNPTSDFVQRDEEWWQTAWNSGAFIGPMQFDDSAGVFSFEVAVRIEGPPGQPIGVIKAVIDVTAVQSFADEFASDDTDEVSVRVLTTDGDLLAETSSGHDPRRIGDTASFGEDQVVAFNQALAVVDGSEGAEDGIRSGFAVLDSILAGYGASSNTREIPRLGIEVPSQQWVAIVEQPEATALAPLNGVEALQSDLNLSVRTLAGLIVALIIVAVVISVVVSRIIAERIAGPVNHLRSEAHRVANEELPRLVASLRDPSSSHQLPEITPIEVNAENEIGELATAFNSVRTTATQLAAGQAVGRSRDVAAILLSLGRRNQQLIGRQLQFIDQLEHSESDPETLQDLFQLDQMATRMRRNAESLLVLAGEDSRRRGTRSVPIDEVIRGSISAVEEFARIDLVATDAVAIKPTAAADVSHLLAELIENAATYSPPDSRIEVIGTGEADNSYTISVLDRGIGMSETALNEANATIRNPAFTERASASQLGLLVVGRLASRHEIVARLVESATIGLTAKVTIPEALLDPVSPLEGHTPPIGVATSETAATPARLEAMATSRPADQVIDISDSAPALPEVPSMEPVVSRITDELISTHGQAAPEAPNAGFVDGTPGALAQPTANTTERPEPPARPMTAERPTERPGNELRVRRRQRSAPEADQAHATTLPSGTGTTDPADAAHSESAQNRADQVRDTLSAFTNGFDKARQEVPGEPSAALQDRANAVRHDLDNFADGIKRGRHDARPPSIGNESGHPSGNGSAAGSPAGSGDGAALPPTTRPRGNGAITSETPAAAAHLSDPNALADDQAADRVNKASSPGPFIQRKRTKGIDNA